MPSCPFIADANYCEINDIGSTVLDTKKDLIPLFL
jgi:hypothetical protein